MKYITIGYPREDGDFDVIATFNLQPLDPADARELEQRAKDIALRLNAELHERQDTPDVITIEGPA